MLRSINIFEIMKNILGMNSWKVYKNLNTKHDSESMNRLKGYTLFSIMNYRKPETVVKDLWEINDTRKRKWTTVGGGNVLHYLYRLEQQRSSPEEEFKEKNQEDFSSRKGIIIVFSRRTPGTIKQFYWQTYLLLGNIFWITGPWSWTYNERPQNRLIIP